MRTITREVCEAFANKTKFRKSNTVCDGNSISIFGNTIAEYRSNKLFITNCGYKTVTTKERLNGLNGVSIHQEKGLWYLNGHLWNGEWVQVDSFNGNVKATDIKKDRATLKKIKEYSKLYLNKDIYPLIPNNGDCWLCNGIIATCDNQHLIDHINEKYTHGSLVVNALRESHYQDEQIGIHLHGFAESNVQRAIYKYLKKRLTNLA